MSYGDFAFFYDLLTQNIDYHELAASYIDAVQCYKAAGFPLLDLACGSGTLSVIMEEQGHTVTGVDLSEGMLTAAAAKSGSIRWLHLDMTEIPFEDEFGVVICSLDGINHLDSLEAIQKTFDGVYRSLKKGGVFIADLNTPYKHLKVLANNAFIFDYEGLFCSWQNELDESDPLCRVDMFLDFFGENEDGSYTRYTDSLSEIAPEPQTVTEMLTKSGFNVREVKDFYLGKPIASETEKYLIAATKD